MYKWWWWIIQISDYIDRPGVANSIIFWGRLLRGSSLVGIPLIKNLVLTLWSEGDGERARPTAAASSISSNRSIYRSMFKSLARKRKILLLCSCYSLNEKAPKNKRRCTHILTDCHCLFFFLKGCCDYAAGSVNGHSTHHQQDPEFSGEVHNITAPVGKDVKFSCHVRHLGTSYKVSWHKHFYLLTLPSKKRKKKNLNFIYTKL